MVVLGGSAVSYERGTPVEAAWGEARNLRTRSSSPAGFVDIQRYLAHKKLPLPYVRLRALGISLP